MHLSITSLLAYTAVASAHTIFQNLRVDGQDQGSLTGIRAPDQNNPTQDVTSPDIACGKVALKSESVITVPAGSKVGSWWQHVIGGAQTPGDADNPIAASHKGPVTSWLAKVDDAAATEHSGLSWFKVAEDGFDAAANVWGVDNMIAGGGWHEFTMPECIAPGQYLLRVELLALHSASEANGAQFYQSCAQIEVTGSGSFEAAETVQFPGVYAQDDPAILTSIYGGEGETNNGGKEYTPAGPRPITC